MTTGTVSAAQSGSSGDDSARIRQIFRYLAEAGESRSKPVRTLDGARHILWFSDLPSVLARFQDTELPGSGGEAHWIRLERPVQQEPPVAPPLLTPWLDAAELRQYTRSQPPGPQPQAELPAEERSTGGSTTVSTSTTEFEGYPHRHEVDRLHRVWAARWDTWAVGARSIASTVQLYEQLYRIHEDVSALGENYELVLGFGYLTWSAGGEAVRRHLVTSRAVLSLAPRTGTITLGPDPEAGSLRLEEAMLDAGQKARPETRDYIRERLEAAGDATTPAQLDALHAALNGWAIAAHGAGRYTRGVERHHSTGPDAPTVSFAPALVLRERTRRTLLDVLQRVAERVEQGAEPTALLRFVAGDGDTAAEGPGLPGAPPGPDALPEETYFALPSNEEQRMIAERLRNNRLVVVQGPPGTGKTHTIANLVTDLLAHGQRVLITSHTARALKVLKDKLPPGISELCVSRTDDGLAAQQELEGSIRALLDRQAGYSPRDYQRRIQQYEDKLRTARTAQALALKKLRILRERETAVQQAEIGDYQGTLQRIAERLADERQDLDWLGPVPAPEQSLAASQVQALLDAARAFTPAHQRLAGTVTGLPSAADLSGPGTFEQAVAAVRAAEQGHAKVRGSAALDHYDEAVTGLGPDARARLADAIDAFSAACAAAEADAGPRSGSGSESSDWVVSARAEVLAGRDLAMRSRLQHTDSALAEVDAAQRDLGTVMITGIDGHDLGTALARATALHDGLRSGERLRGPLGIKTKLRKAVGEFVDTVRVDGRSPEDTATAALVLRRVQLERFLQGVESEWGDGAQPWQPPARRIARLREESAALHRLAGLADRHAALRAAASSAAALAAVSWQEPGTVSAVRGLLRAHAALLAAEQPRVLLAATADTLRRWADRPGFDAPALRRMRSAVDAQDPEAYSSAWTELTELREALRLKDEHNTARATVAGALPGLADALTGSPEDPMWDHRLRVFERAWAWSAWSARMQELTDPAEEDRQHRLLAEADSDIRITLDKLAADRAWHGCLQRLTDDQAVALTSYQQSVRRLGKGTGKYAHKYRLQARESLRECQDAVPAWIMPLYQVAETVPMETAGRFDVVIIDEASQSGPEALLLAWLGAKIIVVGDDKQVSPSNIGIDHEELFQLKDRLLAGLPAFRRHLFNPTASFFDIATGLAGGRGRLMLQEHFRCMPEIIGFSNELCYDGKLQPLRQYGADRLPPLRSVPVPEGYIDGTGQKQVNQAEAERLVNEMVRCCADPAYDGRTMGVITMLGAAQKFLIEDLLAERLPLDERQRRRLRVGDAEDFQGDERDIVFISLVVSLAGAEGQRRIGPFSSTAAQQRLNVAASRARDQVWLFHSVTMTDLGETDLRRRYLDYFSRPMQEQDGTGLGEVSPDERHEAFDSLFEQRVFLALRRRGYRVRPQYPTGRFRIDLVVEGGTRRLAVECDGDAFHNEENAEADAARQRELERVGWTFVRIRGSRFFLDPERALEPLWRALDHLGIESAHTAPPPARATAVPSPAPTQRPDPGAASAPQPDPAPGLRATGSQRAKPRTTAPNSAPSPTPVPTPVPTRPAKADVPSSARPKVRAEPEEQPQPVPVPDGYRSVGWIRPFEVKAAQRAFARHSTVPIDEGGAVQGEARYVPGAGIPGRPGEDVVEIRRGKDIRSHLLREEVNAMRRAETYRTDVAVFLREQERIGLVQYFAPASPEALTFHSTVRLLRVRPSRAPHQSDSGATRSSAEPERAPQSPPEARTTTGRPRTTSNPDPRTARSVSAPPPTAPPARTSDAPTTSGRPPRLRVDRLSVNAYRRVQAELDRIHDELARPEPEIIAVDSSSRTAQRAATRERGLRLEERRDYLRYVLAHVVPDPNHSGGGLVTPGCLVGIEDEDGSGITVCEISALKPVDAEWLAPDSALGKAILWRDVGDEVTYVTDAGTRLTVTIRFIDD